jgi:hypothetical protein
MRAAVGACRRATAESLLGCLGKDSLKAVCAAVGVPAAGRREELIERILTGNGRSQGATGKKRERSMSEEAAKPETSARLTAPQREARGTANGNDGKLDVPRLVNWLWEAACVIRGPVDAPKFKDYSRGSGNEGSNKERDIRREFVEQDLIEAVLLLPENLFYNTTAPGIVMIVNRRKRHPGEILLINANKLFSKGRPKTFLEDPHIDRIAGAYQTWKPEEGLSAVISKAEAVKNDYNLSPSRYVATGAKEEVLPLGEAVVLLAEAEEERAEADQELDRVLAKLGFSDWRGGGDNGAKR